MPKPFQLGMSRAMGGKEDFYNVSDPDTRGFFTKMMYGPFQPGLFDNSIERKAYQKHRKMMDEYNEFRRLDNRQRNRPRIFEMAPEIWLPGTEPGGPHSGSSRDSDL